jgi:putative ubiquitin-RnfH superfamily antitoxin RatB of RatAB toxin-antitoxin module
VSDDQTVVVEVAFALPDKQAIVEVQVSPGTTALEAAQQSGIVDRFEGLTLEDAKLGVFGKAVANTYVMSAGERVEIYRPLLIDPKEVRKARAAEVKERKAKEAMEKASAGQ